MAYIQIVNGPNLNLLGRRQPEIYGTTTLDDIIGGLKSQFEPSVEIRHFVSNHEGALIDTIQTAGFDPECLGIVINAGAYTHTSLAIADAVAAIPVPVVEVHISNIAAREEIRHRSLITPYAKGIIAGLGTAGYKLAADFLVSE
ncbi:MAG: 3-dehydroquinate dehydratase [Muribaculaceae bacterium]|nr:3-dehydroquinate dehydratase [Muribaculaceae bacterium]